MFQAIQESDCDAVRVWCEDPSVRGNINEFKDTRDVTYHSEDRSVSVEGMTALHHAAYWNKLDILKILVLKGAGKAMHMVIEV